MGSLVPGWDAPPSPRAASAYDAPKGDWVPPHAHVGPAPPERPAAHAPAEPCAAVRVALRRPSLDAACGSGAASPRAASGAASPRRGGSGAGSPQAQHMAELLRRFAHEGEGGGAGGGADSAAAGHLAHAHLRDKETWSARLDSAGLNAARPEEEAPPHGRASFQLSDPAHATHYAHAPAPAAGAGPRPAAPGKPAATVERVGAPPQ